MRRTQPQLGHATHLNDQTKAQEEEKNRNKGDNAISRSRSEVNQRVEAKTAGLGDVIERGVRD